MMPDKNLIIKDFPVGTIAVDLHLACFLYVSGVGW